MSGTISPPEYRFSTAASTDADTYYFDVSAWAAVNSEDITNTVSCVITPLDNLTNPTLSTLTIASGPTVNGNVVSVKLTGGTAGTDYTIAMQVNTATRTATFYAQLFIGS